MLEEVRGKVADPVPAHIVKEVVEVVAKAQGLAEESKQKVVQLVVPEKNIA